MIWKKNLNQFHTLLPPKPYPVIMKSHTVVLNHRTRGSFSATLHRENEDNVVRRFKKCALFSWGHLVTEYKGLHCSLSHLFFSHICVSICCVSSSARLCRPTRKQPSGQPTKLLSQQPGTLLVRLLQKVTALYHICWSHTLACFLCQRCERDKTARGDRQKSSQRETKGGEEGEQVCIRGEEVWICCCARSNTSWGAGSLPLHSQVPRSVTGWLMLCMTGPSHYVHSCSGDTVCVDGWPWICASVRMNVFSIWVYSRRYGNTL